MKRYRPLFSETHPYYIEKYINKRANVLSNFYKRMEHEEEKSWYPSFIPLFEAVIRPDKYVSIIINELRPFLKENNGKSFKYAFQICMLLNKLFQKYNFEFVEKNEGGIDPRSGIDEASTQPKNFKTIFRLFSKS